MIRLVFCMMVALAGCARAPRPRPISSQRCTPLHEKLGRYSTVIFQRCPAAENRWALTLTVVITDLADGGRRAGAEAAREVLRYLGRRPKLALLTMGRVRGNPVYLFVVTGFE